VGAPLKSIPPAVGDEHLEELGRLADTAGVDAVGTARQRLDSPNPRLFVGEGKAEEIRDLATELGATLILFDEELTPAQGKNLEKFTGVRIMDRAELILDIFATRARTAEAKMQVELAQLQYLLPRLTRMWAHLSRTRGGVSSGGAGMRGPGETQLETDRRLVNLRIARLKEELEKVARQRATQRKGRSGVLRAALVGYTNAGKSSILRGLASDPGVFVEDRLFATLDAATRSVELGEGAEVLVTDTVGFIRKLPHHLVASFRATLEEAREADVLLHVIDASHPLWEEQRAVVDEVLADLGLSDRPTVLVFNKVDRLTHEEEAGMREQAAAAGQDAVFVSALAPGGLQPLLELLQDRLKAVRATVTVVLPASDGKTLAELYREGEVLERADEGSSVTLRLRLPAPALGRLRGRGVEVLEAP
jgi:GTPase